MSDPKGLIFIVGGAEDRENARKLDAKFENRQFNEYEILEAFVNKVGAESTVEIITTATSKAKELYNLYRDTFKKLGLHKTRIIDIQNREEAYSEKFEARIKEANGVFFTGGNQFKLTTILGGTKLIEIMSDKYYKDSSFVIGGSSAGAAAMSTVMIYEGTMEAPLKGDVKTMSGLGFITNCIIDTHFLKRRRFGRLAYTVIMNPTCVGIGLGEDTALIVEQGNIMTTIGSGMVTVIDGSGLKYTNINSAENCTPVCAENLIVHILAKGNGYILDQREFIADKKDRNKGNSTEGN